MTRLNCYAMGIAALILTTMPHVLNAQVLHIFSGADGQGPRGGLVRDSSGVFYGTTAGGGTEGQYPGGTVFKLTPPAAGSRTWVEQVIYQFPASANDGVGPVGSLLSGPGGVLYGATFGGQGSSIYGTIFQLAPPVGASGSWTETILHAFHLQDGSLPQGDLIKDASGALYGTTGGGGTSIFGTVFKLAPPTTPRGQWTLQTLHNFGSGNDGSDPIGKLAMDASGNLYGATQTGGGGSFYGTVFQLSPPAAGQSDWTQTILHSFNGSTDGGFPLAGLSIDARGALYGTTPDGGSGTTCDLYCGTVYKMTPPSVAGGAWIYDVIYDFHGPDGDSPQTTPVLDHEGNLYGTTYDGGVVKGACFAGCGVVYKLAPPALGSGPWTETFYAPANNTLPNQPLGDLLLSKDGYAYGTSRYGGVPRVEGDGTIFRIHQ